MNFFAGVFSKTSGSAYAENNEIARKKTGSSVFNAKTDCGCRFIVYKDREIVGTFNPFSTPPDFKEPPQVFLKEAVDSTLSWINQAKGDVFSLNCFESKINKLHPIDVKDIDTPDYITNLIKKQFVNLYEKYVKSIRISKN